MSYEELMAKLDRLVRYRLYAEWAALTDEEKRALLLRAYESTGVRVPEDLRRDA